MAEPLAVFQAGYYVCSECHTAFDSSSAFDRHLSGRRCKTLPEMLRDGLALSHNKNNAWRLAKKTNRYQEIG